MIKVKVKNVNSMKYPKLMSKPTWPPTVYNMMQTFKI